jgi:hypothetical protein
MYNYIIGIDDELWDVIEDEPEFEVEEAMVTDKKTLIVTQKNIYKNHHKVKVIIVEALPHAKYAKIRDRSTAKSIFESLCSTYEGNQ